MILSYMVRCLLCGTEEAAGRSAKYTAYSNNEELHDIKESEIS
jgi:hypothetical protein